MRHITIEEAQSYYEAGIALVADGDKHDYTIVKEAV